MVLKNVNDVCLESDEPREAEDGELQQPTREERLMKYRNQCKNLVEYLSQVCLIQFLKEINTIKT